MSHTRTGEGGFTLIELMVTVAITSFIGLVVLQGAVHARRTTERISIHAHNTIRTLQMERSLREQTSHIRIPYWIGDFEAFIDADAVEVELPFYDGEADRSLVVKHWEDTLFIGTKGDGAEEMSNLLQLDGILDIRFGVIENDAGEQVGIRYEVITTWENDHPVVIAAGFGGNPFWCTAR